MELTPLLQNLFLAQCISKPKTVSPYIQKRTRVLYDDRHLSSPAAKPLVVVRVFYVSAIIEPTGSSNP